MHREFHTVDQALGLWICSMSVCQYVSMSVCQYVSMSVVQYIVQYVSICPQWLAVLVPLHHM